VLEGISGKGKAQLRPKTEFDVGDPQPWVLLAFPERGAKM
jgi:hypothetical protein